MSDNTMNCPCDRNMSYADCCKPYHDGANIPEAVAAMRARFSAFVLEKTDFLLRTWDPLTRPKTLELNTSLEYTRLVVHHYNETSVYFSAYYLFRGLKGVHVEYSYFRKDSEGSWLYTHGDELLD